TWPSLVVLPIQTTVQKYENTFENNEVACPFAVHPAFLERGSPRNPDNYVIGAGRVCQHRGSADRHWTGNPALRLCATGGHRPDFHCGAAWANQDRRLNDE